MSRMKDIDDIRRDNLRRIEKECGSPSATASLLKMSPAQFANLRDGAKDSRTGKPRGMRKTTAREIEINAGKPVGWLDIDHSAEPAAAVGMNLTPAAQAVVDLVVAADAGKLPAHLFDSLGAALRVWLNQPGVTESGKGD